MLHRQGLFETEDHLQLYERAWLPQEATRSAIIIVHGYAEHSGRYAALATLLVARGHAVHTYDQRGHGRSEGRRAFVRVFDDYLDDLARFVDRVRGIDPDLPLFLFGHSMGGAISALFCIERRTAFKGLILSSPSLRLGNVAPGLLRRFAHLISRLFPTLPTVALDRSLLSRDAAVVAQVEQDDLYYDGGIPARTGTELLQAARRIQEQMEALTLPLLLIHGTADQIADPLGSQELYYRAGSTDKTLGLYDGLYHETFREPERDRVIEEIVTWLDEHL